MHIWMAGECWRLRRALPVTGHKAHCCNWWTQGMRVHMGAWFLDDVDKYHDINTSLTMQRVMLLCRCRGALQLAMPHQISFPVPNLWEPKDLNQVHKGTKVATQVLPSLESYGLIQHYRTLDREISWNLTTKLSKLGNYLRLAMKDLTPLHFHKARVADSGISGPCIRSIRIHSLGHLMVPRKYRKLEENCC